MSRFDNYMSGYLDRRMRLIMDEWGLSTRGELRDLVQRMHTLQDEVRQIKGSEDSAADRISRIEERISRLKERA
jgi:hypothetical protein